MMQTPLLDAARAWVIERYPYNRHHLLKALEWLDRVAPDSSEAVRLATLTHDMERAFPGPDQPVIKTLSDPEYERLHSLRSARIVGAWLREQHASEALVEHVEALIVAHEFGGWPEADLVQARLHRWAQKLGLADKAHPHALRHSFASHVLQSSGDLRAVQELLGHANIGTTQVYTRLDFQHLAKAYDAAHPRAKRKP